MSRGAINPRGARGRSGCAAFTIATILLTAWIGLMDLPDGKWVNAQVREQIAASVQKIAGRDARRLTYDPAASLDVRRQERAPWQRWLENPEFGNATRLY